MKRTLLAVTFTLCLCNAQIPNFRIDRIAGIRPNAFQPVAARDGFLSTPYAIAVDRAGTIYFQDRDNYVIRRLSTDGVLTVFAGNGQTGNSGDGGPATSARVGYFIGSMNFGPDGALYFADGPSCTVRRVTTAGIMERVAGVPFQCGYSGDGGPALAARLNLLGSVFFDHTGNLYIGDPGNSRVRRVRPDGNIETFAGTGAFGFTGDGGPANQTRLNTPFALADTSGSVIILDTYNYRIRRVNADGIVTTIAGNGVRGVTPDNGPALTSSIGWIEYAVAHPNGNIYFSDRATHKMYALTPDGFIRRVLGTGHLGYSGDGGPADSADVPSPDDFAVAPDGSLVFVDPLNQVVRRLTLAGSVETIAGRQRFDGNYGVAWEQILNGPAGVAWDPKGGYYIYEQFGARVRRVDPDGTMVTVAGTGEHGVEGDGGPARKAHVGLAFAADSFALSTGPALLAVDDQRRVYIVDAESSRVRRFVPGDLIELVAGSGDAGFTGDGGPATQARLNRPSGIAIARDGRVFIADTNNNRIRVVDLDGSIRTFAGSGVRGFLGDGGAALQARLASPGPLGFDREGNLFFLDLGNSRIRRIGTDGVISTVVGSGVAGPLVDGVAKEVPLANLASLAVAPDGALLFAEVSTFASPYARLRYVGPDQRVVTLNPAAIGYEGEGEPVSRAAFSAIQQISINLAGDILIADRDNHVIRQLTVAGGGN